MDFLDTQATRVVNKALDGMAERHNAIVSNIANAETPGYQAMSVNFEDNLKQAIDAENNSSPDSQFLPTGSLETTNPLHINPKPVASSIDDSTYAVERAQFEYRHDANSVDVEKSMVDMAKNSGTYTTVAKLQSKYLSELKSVIKGGS